MSWRDSEPKKETTIIGEFLNTPLIYLRDTVPESVYFPRQLSPTTVVPLGDPCPHLHKFHLLELGHTVPMSHVGDSMPSGSVYRSTYPEYFLPSFGISTYGRDP